MAMLLYDKFKNKTKLNKSNQILSVGFISRRDKIKIDCAPGRELNYIYTYVLRKERENYEEDY